MSSRYGGKRVKKGLTHFVLGKAVSAICGFLAMVLVIRLLPVQAFAHYSVLVSLIEIFTAFSALGLSHALVRYVPELYAKHYKIALKDFVFRAFLLRTALLLGMLIVAYIWATPIATLFGMASFMLAFKWYLWVVLLRTTLFFVSQILESTLHQGISQIAFSLSAVIRLAGMLYLNAQDSNINAHADLIAVILVEIVSDVLGLVVMLLGVFYVVWHDTISAANPVLAPADDANWLKTNIRQIKNLALTGYAQHIIGLPFGSNTNRLVGGYLFSSPVMASFGFAQSFYEYIKRYLPAQLLVGLIRPIIVARYSHKRDFATAASTCEKISLINITIIGAMFTLLIVGGKEAIAWVSAGKYGLQALWLLLALMLVLALETHRLILEMLVQTVERYVLLIPSNLVLALSVLPAILLFDQLGAVGFPLVNALALLVCNAWVKRKLAKEGFLILHNKRAMLQLICVVIATTLLGLVLKGLGMHWLMASVIVQIGFFVWVWLMFGELFKKLVTDLLGRKTDTLLS